MTFYDFIIIAKLKIKEVIAKVRNLPFDKLRVNGLKLKSLTFSVRGELVEPQKNTFAIGSKIKNILHFTIYVFHFALE